MSVYSNQRKNQRNTLILIFLFVGLVSAVFYVFSAYYNNPAFAFVGLGISVIQAAIAYFTGDRIALAVSGGKQVNQEQAPQIHQIVENLSKIANIPKPKIYISSDKSANAFATGRNPDNASICLNQGILDILTKSELEGVIAHELAHIKNRDILIMTVTMVLSSVISFIADFGFRLMFWGGDKNRDNDSNSPIILILYIITILLAPFVSILIQLSISRSREYQADATAVVFTRYPQGLINALLKLHQSPIPTSHYSTSMNHFYISEPKKKWGEKVQSLFSTHPPVKDRVKALQSFA
ncbi:M48 family metallopeptidase [Candidatus Gracilibacteria bacterium]|nr:M48 family metallopeptidase [Candidatus Gracilibacteria bacterium]NJS40869.1 M48 family metallopeptidase [Candidatus Gracilibacteria bacterium]